MLKQTVTVTALKPFELQGRSYVAGQAVTLSPIDAVVLSRKRFVTLSKRKAITPEPEPIVIPEPEPEPPKARRTYKRRDMQAEQSTAFEAEEARSPIVIDDEPTSDAD